VTASNLTVRSFACQTSVIPRRKQSLHKQTNERHNCLQPIAFLHPSNRKLLAGITVIVCICGTLFHPQNIFTNSRDSSVCIALATGWRIGIVGFDSWRGLGKFLFTTASRTALGPTQPPIQWVPGTLSLGVKRPGREADHSPPSSAEVKECVELYRHEVVLS
jgi:hypothetical protein